MQKKSPRNTRKIGGTDGANFSLHHGATENGEIRRPPSRNVIGPKCPPVTVRNASTSRVATRHEACPITIRVFIASPPPRPLFPRRATHCSHL
jgi:hypothetical protein